MIDLGEARRLRDAGLSFTEIGARLGVHRSTVQRRLDTPGCSLSRDVEHQEIPVIVRDYSHLPSLKVYPLGDLHIGAQGHQAQRWSEWLGYLLENKDTSLLGTGDFLNAAIVGSKSDIYDEVLTVGKAKRHLLGQLRPLAEENRIDVLLPGNHEDRITRAIGDCPVEDLADSLGVPYVRAAAMIVYRVGDVEYDVYVRHGTGNGQSLAQLAKSAMVATADAFVTGHTHKAAVTADEYFVRVGDRLERRRRYYVSSGSFLSLENYAAQRGYAPTRLGAPRIDLDGRRKDVHVSL